MFNQRDNLISTQKGCGRGAVDGYLALVMFNAWCVRDCCCCCCCCCCFVEGFFWFVFVLYFSVGAQKEAAVRVSNMKMLMLMLTTSVTKGRQQL